MDMDITVAFLQLKNEAPSMPSGLDELSHIGDITHNFDSHLSAQTASPESPPSEDEPDLFVATSSLKISTPAILPQKIEDTSLIAAAAISEAPATILSPHTNQPIGAKPAPIKKLAPEGIAAVEPQPVAAGKAQAALTALSSHIAVERLRPALVSEGRAEPRETSVQVAPVPSHSSSPLSIPLIMAQSTKAADMVPPAMLPQDTSIQKPNNIVPTPRIKALPAQKAEYQQMVQPGNQPSIQIHTSEHNLQESPPEHDLRFQLKIDRQEPVLTQQTQNQAKQTPPVHSQIATQMQQQVSRNSQQVIELRLDPPELGRVVIHLTTQDQTVVALVSADRQETLDLMRRHSEVLSSTLEKAGFSQSNLSFQQGSQQQNQHEFSSQHELAAYTTQNEASEPAITAPVIDGRLDIRL